LSGFYNSCFFYSIVVLIIFYIIAGIVYAEKKSTRGFMIMVVFPLPIIFVSAVILYNGHRDPEYYLDFLRIMVFLSIFLGIGVLAHCIYDRMERNWLLWIRFIAGAGLVISPILILFPDYYSTIMLCTYLLCGGLLGTYGYISYYSGKKIGLLYAYTSIIYIVFIPLVAIALSSIYFEVARDEIIYRRSPYRWVTCHLPALLIPGEELSIPIVYTSGYLGLMGLVASIRRSRLKARMKKDGTIPEGFEEIEKGEDDEE